MAEPADTATKHLHDNRTVIGGKDSAGARIAILPTLPDGKAFTAQKGNGTAATGTVVVGDPAKPAHIGSVDVERVVVPIDFATTTGAGGGSKYVRKQFFKSAYGGPSDGKWYYVNKDMVPLKADGTKATAPAFSDAANANTTPLTAVGEAMTNYAQPGPVPGTYQVSERQQGYNRYLGWTVKQGPTGS